jgi:hypothetical protein
VLKEDRKNDKDASNMHEGMQSETAVPKNEIPPCGGIDWFGNIELVLPSKIS